LENRNVRVVAGFAKWLETWARRCVTVSLQGFGNVAQHAARRFVQAGGAVTAVSSWDAKNQHAYTFKRPGGIEPEQLSQVTDRFGTIDRDAAVDYGYEVLPGSAWLEEHADEMRTALADVHERAERDQISLRDAAYLIAVERVAHACRARGWV
jgi:glutamate dehydrogenase/leucine dehydrogenase